MVLKRLLALVAALCLLAVFVSCASEDEDQTADNGQTSNNDKITIDQPLQDNAASDTSIQPQNRTASYKAAGIDPDAVVLTINGEDVTAREYFYWMDSCYEYMVYSYGEVEDWDTMATDELTIRQYLMSDTLESVKFYHIFTTTGAEHGGIIEDADMEEVDAYYEMYVNEYFGGEEAYNQTLESLFITDELFKFTHCEIPVLYYKVFYNLFDSSDFLAAAGEDEVNQYVQENIISQNYIRAAHILIKTVDDDMEPLSEEETAAALELANELLERLQNGEDFFTLMEEYSQDDGKTQYPTGYYFNADSGFVDEFYNAAVELEEDQLSGIVESVYGYHIILRLPIQNSDFAEDTCWNQYDKILATWRAEAEVVYSDVYQQIDPQVIYG